MSVTMIGKKVDEMISKYIQKISDKYKIPLHELHEILFEHEEEDENMTVEENINKIDYSKMTVSELKKLCTTLGLKKQSTKTKLLETIQEYYDKNKTITKSVPNNSQVNNDMLVLKDKVVTADEEEDLPDNISDSSSFDDTFILDGDDDDENPNDLF